MRLQPMIVLTLMVFMGGSAAALGGGVPADSGADCAEWNTVDFFKKASTEEVSACLEAGADPKFRDEKGRIPLILAAAHTRHPGVIAALIQAGADIRAVGRGGENPLHAAASSNENPGVITALLDAGANPRARAHVQHGMTPLEMAAEGNTNPEVLDALLKAGADPKSKNKFGLTPLHFAARRNSNPAIITALVNAGADPNAHGDRFPSRQTPLFHAIEWGGSSCHCFCSGGSRRRPQCTNRNISGRKDSADPGNQVQRPSRNH